jgi:GTP cyclohydrolase IA
MVTSRMVGAFREDEKTRREFLTVVGTFDNLRG